MTAQIRNNNFDALRLIAATMVVVGHAYVVLGRSDGPNILGGGISPAGVIIFFSVSGYLVAQSWKRDSRLAEYLRKRLLRIGPGLAVCVAVCAFAFGPLMSTDRNYFLRVQFWKFLGNFLLIYNGNLPGVFENQPLPEVMNGSLWTLPIEFVCYFSLPVIALFGKRKIYAQCVLLLLLLFIKFGNIAGLTQIDPSYPIYFLIGSIIAMGEIPLSNITAAAFVVILIFFDIYVGGVFLKLLKPFLIPYLLICFGTASVPLVRNAGRFGDISYGLYLYAFPVQQIVVHCGATDPVVVILNSWPTACLIGLASWHLVEKRALALKSRRDISPPGPIAPNVGGQA